MKVTVVQCDSCGARMEPNEAAKVTLTQDRVNYSGDYCAMCASTLRGTLPERKSKPGRKKEAEVSGSPNGN